MTLRSSLLTNAGLPGARLLNADGRAWVVREVPAPEFDWLGGTHLVFESNHVMRRVKTFPPSWPDLPDAHLYALTERIR